MFKASPHGESCQAGTTVCAGHSAVESGGDVEKCRGGRHGVYVPATGTQARRAGVLSRDASAMGGVHEELAGAMAVDAHALCRETDGAG